MLNTKKHRKTSLPKVDNPNTEDTSKRYDDLKKHLVNVKVFLLSFQLIDKIKIKKYKINEDREVVEEGVETKEKASDVDIFETGKPGVFTFGKSLYDKFEKLNKIFKKRTDDIEDGSDEEGKNLFEFFTKLPFLATVAAIACLVKLIYDAIVPKIANAEGIGITEGIGGIGIQQGNAEMLESTQAKVSYKNKETGGTETRTGGSLAWRTNNPGNIVWSDFAKKHGAIGKVGVTAVFPTFEVGRAAEKALLESPSYSKLTLEEIIRKWSTQLDLSVKTKEAQDTIGINKPYYTLTSEEKSKFVSLMERYEGYKVGEITTTKGIEGQVQDTVLDDKNVPDVITVDIAKKYIEFGNRTGDEEHFEKLNPQFKRKVYKLAEFYFKNKHKKIHIHSAYRSEQEQRDLPDTGKKAIGISHHTKREAIDINAEEELFFYQQKGLLEGLGIRSGRTFRRVDPGHLQVIPNRSKPSPPKKSPPPPKTKERVVSTNLDTKGTSFNFKSPDEGTESPMFAYTPPSLNINLGQQINIYEINDTIDIIEKREIGYREIFGV